MNANLWDTLVINKDGNRIKFSFFSFLNFLYLTFLNYFVGFLILEMIETLFLAERDVMVRRSLGHMGRYFETCKITKFKPRAVKFSIYILNSCA